MSKKFKVYKKEGRGVIMQFRDLRRQYEYLKDEIDKEILDVINSASFISGKQVEKLEKQLAEFVGVNHCITCGNGT